VQRNSNLFQLALESLKAVFFSIWSVLPAQLLSQKYTKFEPLNIFCVDLMIVRVLSALPLRQAVLYFRKIFIHCDRSYHHY